MWIVTILFSIVVFLITGNPLLAILLPYLVAAEPSIQSAIWLRLRDPLFNRGKTCFWFYLAAAGWIAALTAFAHLLLFFLIETVFGVAVKIDAVVDTMVVLMVGVGITTALGTIGIVAAFRRGVRVFVVPKLFQLCGRDFNVACAVTAHRRRLNHAMFIVVLSIFLPIIVAGIVLIGLATVGRNLNNPDEVLLWTGIGTTFFGPLAAIPFYAHCSHRIIARTPSDCWPEQILHL